MWTEWYEGLDDTRQSQTPRRTFAEGDANTLSIQHLITESRLEWDYVEKDKKEVAKSTGDVMMLDIENMVQGSEPIMMVA